MVLNAVGLSPFLTIVAQSGVFVNAKSVLSALTNHVAAHVNISWYGGARFMPQDDT